MKDAADPNRQDPWWKVTITGAEGASLGLGLFLSCC